METTTKKDNQGNEYLFVCEYFETRYNWGHKCTLFINNVEVQTGKAIYYNRTWESYRFQSVMKIALYNYINEVQDRTVQQYKEQNNIKRLTRARRESVLETCQELKNLYSVYETL